MFGQRWEFTCLSASKHFNGVCRRKGTVFFAHDVCSIYCIYMYAILCYRLLRGPGCPSVPLANQISDLIYCNLKKCIIKCYKESDFRQKPCHEDLLELVITPAQFNAAVDAVAKQIGEAWPDHQR